MRSPSYLIILVQYTIFIFGQLDGYNFKTKYVFVSLFVCLFLGFTHYNEVPFSSFFSGGFITTIVVDPPERKLAKRTTVLYSVTLPEDTELYLW